MPTTLIDVPLATNTLAASQPSIRTNFNVISDAFEQDHVAYNVTVGVATQGMHNQVTMPRQGGDSATDGTNVALYSKVSATSGDTALFFRKQGNGVVYDFTSSTQATPGWTRLPSGILIKWGNITANINNNTLVAFNAGPPAFSACWNVQATTSDLPAHDNICIMVGNITAAGFNVFPRAIGGTTGGPMTFNWLAIGLG